jgi:hypothetical protein
MAGQRSHAIQSSKAGAEKIVDSNSQGIGNIPIDSSLAISTAFVHHIA